MKRTATCAAALALCLHATCAWPLGFGRTSPTPTVLGRPLDLSLSLHVEPGEIVDDSCVRAEILFGESHVPSSDVRIDVDRISSTERVVRVRTVSPVDEPVVSATVTAGCEAKVSRKLVVFADPPVGSLPSVAMSTPAVPLIAQALSETGEARAASRPASAPRAAGSNRSRGTASTPRKERSAAVAASATTGGEVAPATQVVAAAATATSNLPSARISGPAHTPATEGARLQLDPIDVDAQILPLLRQSASVSQPEADGGPRRAAAAAMWRVLNASPEELAKQAERLSQLEADLNRLRETAAADRAVANGLKARLQDAQRRQFNNPIVFALAGLCLALAGGVGYLLWRRRDDPAPSSSWWSPTQMGLSESMLPVDAAAPAAASAAAAAGPVQAEAEADTGPDSDAAIVVSEFGAEAPAAEQSVSPGVAREVSVEELIDLEQQVDFFLVLGQDEAAIDLLASHVDSSAGTSPLPYLKLLEIYQRRGARKEYELIRQRFNNCFNAYAPEWESDLERGRSIEDYPAVSERLGSIWSSPRRALGLLQASLLRQDGDENTFDLPAYRELLFLYGIARDLAEREHERERDDLSSPLAELGHAFEHTSPDAGFGPTVVQPLLATAPLHLQMGVSGAPLSIDLEIDGGDGTPGLPPGDVDLMLPLDEAADLRPEDTLPGPWAGSARQDEDGHSLDFEAIDLPALESEASEPSQKPDPVKDSGRLDLDLLELTETPRKP